MSLPGAAVDPSLGSAVMRTVTSPPFTGSVAGSMGSTTMLVELVGSAPLPSSHASS